MKRVRSKLTYANVISTLALFLVLAGGTAFAAKEMLPKNSVGSEQIKKGAVTPKKLSKSARAKLAGPRGPAGATGAQGPQGTPGVTNLAQPVLNASGGPVTPPEPGSGFASIPLSGATNWVARPGQTAVLYGQVNAVIGFNATGEKKCLLRVEIRDGETTIAGTYFETPGLSNEAPGQLHPLAYSTYAALGFDGRQYHEINARVTEKGPDCMNGTEVKSVRVMAQPLG
jgi:hypothetical protein